MSVTLCIVKQERGSHLSLVQKDVHAKTQLTITGAYRKSDVVLFIINAKQLDGTTTNYHLDQCT